MHPLVRLAQQTPRSLPPGVLARRVSAPPPVAHGSRGRLRAEGDPPASKDCSCTGSAVGGAVLGAIAGFIGAWMLNDAKKDDLKKRAKERGASVAERAAARLRR